MHVPVASLKSLWSGIWQIEALKGVEKWSRDHRKMQICIWTHVEKFADSKNVILFDLDEK